MPEDPREASSLPSHALSEACFDFLAYASDQLPHLRSGDHEKACYVGRRLDQTWRRLDWVATVWLADRYQEVVSEAEKASDIDVAIEKVSRLPSLASADGADSLNGDAADGLDSAVRLIAGLVERSQEHVDVRDLAITMHLVRRSYSAYRVAKYRWLEAERAAGRYQPYAAYRWLEA